jgi:hypothetical protein
LRRAGFGTNAWPSPTSIMRSMNAFHWPPISMCSAAPMNNKHASSINLPCIEPCFLPRPSLGNHICASACSGRRLQRQREVELPPSSNGRHAPMGCTVPHRRTPGVRRQLPLVRTPTNHGPCPDPLRMCLCGDGARRWQRDDGVVIAEREARRGLLAHKHG